MNTVQCPVTGAPIDGAGCLVICDVADKMLKPSALPEGIVWNEEQRQKCLKCKYHADLTDGE